MKTRILNFLIVLAFLIYAFLHWGFYFIFTILAISFLIFFHELGHFLAAKIVGVHVNVFSVGFGEKIFSKTINNTTYQISSIPLGGYVNLKGQDDMDPNLRNYDPDSYNSISALKRIFILFAGPFFNIFLAFFIYIILGYVGVEKIAPKIGAIQENMPAAEAGLMIDDVILKINSKEITYWDEIKKNISTKPVNIQILRDKNIINITLTPKISSAKTIFNEDVQKPLIGILPKNEFVTVYNKGFLAVSFAMSETIQASKLIFLGLEKLIVGVVPITDMGGIVRMADITTKAATISASVFLLIVALISVNLGILNLLPIPVLDGGHIIFNIYELIFKKEIPQKVSSTLIYLGMAMLASLMIFTIINDIFQLSRAG